MNRAQAAIRRAQGKSCGNRVITTLSGEGLILHNGGLLMRNGALAASTNCCCRCDPCTCCGENKAFDTVSIRFPVWLNTDGCLETIWPTMFQEYNAQLGGQVKELTMHKFTCQFAHEFGPYFAETYEDCPFPAFNYEGFYWYMATEAHIECSPGDPGSTTIACSFTWVYTGATPAIEGGSVLIQIGYFTTIPESPIDCNDTFILDHGGFAAPEPPPADPAGIDQWPEVTITTKDCPAPSGLSVKDEPMPATKSPRNFVSRLLGRTSNAQPPFPRAKCGTCGR